MLPKQLDFGVEGANSAWPAWKDRGEVSKRAPESFRVPKAEQYLLLLSEKLEGRLPGFTLGLDGET